MIAYYLDGNTYCHHCAADDDGYVHQAFSGPFDGAKNVFGLTDTCHRCAEDILLSDRFGEIQ